MLDIRPLTIERVVSNPAGLGLSTGKTTLDEIANRGRTGLLAHTKTEAVHIALGEYDLGSN